MSLVCLKPCDNTFFGDGKQFNFGMSNVITSKYTPYPSVFFGAIFTALLTKNNEFRKKFFELGNYDHEKILQINQVYLYNEKNKSKYLPAPKDLFINSFGEILIGKFKELKIEDNISTSGSYERILMSPKDEDYKRVENKYINEHDIENYYAIKDSESIELVDINNIFVKNSKIGIKLDKTTKSAEESMLYRSEQVEFISKKSNNKSRRDVWSYLVDYEIINNDYKGTKIFDLDDGYLSLGGENKVCKFSKIDIDMPQKDKKNENYSKGEYKIIFTSDTFFETKLEDILGENIRILGMASDKPIYIGGYDMEKQKSNTNKYRGVRKMYKGYSAGTVILIETLKDGVNINLSPDNSKGFNKFLILKER